MQQATADQIQARDAMFELVIGNARNDFLTFVRLVAPQLIADFKMGRHIEVICSKLQAVEEGKVKIKFFDNKNSDINKDKILNKGDIIILFEGGHGFKILEKSKIIEVKQGPYVEGKDKKIIKNKVA